MRIALLSRSSSTYTTRRLSDVARSRGHHVRILDPLRCELLLDGQNAQVLYQGKSLPRFDLVIPRIAQSITGYGLAVLAQFTLRGAVPVNDATAIAQAHNKLGCLQALASRGIDVPRTVMAGDDVNLNELAGLVGGVPVLVRLLSSGQRTGMMICETIESTKAALETVLGLGQNFILQRYVRERRGRDLRALVVGDRVLAAVRRRARPGRLAKSLARGARFAEVSLSARQARVAVESARVVGLQVAAVDMLELDGKLRVFEVNASPGLREMEATTGLDLVTPIVELGEATLGLGPSRSGKEARRAS